MQVTRTKEIINDVNKKYSTPDEKLIKKQNNTNDSEYKKIHNIELLVERILDNHENVGSAFTKTNRRVKLLSLELDRINNKIYKNNIEDFGWEYLSESKRNSRYTLSKERIERECGFNSSELQETKSSVKATENAFVSVYDDLIKSRDSYLIYEERQKHLTKKNSTFQCYRRPELRYTAKKRLLFFFMRGEEFTNMDLSGVSLSGADLQ